jgi:hypothetical protein
MDKPEGCRYLRWLAFCMYHGSEFQRHFATALAKQLATHWHTFPKAPKMNAHCERFNRTVQEEFLDYHYDLLFLDELTELNLELLRSLSWYNLERPHFSLCQPVPGRKTSSALPITIPPPIPPVQYVLARYTRLSPTADRDTVAFPICYPYWGESVRGESVRGESVRGESVRG